jgi:membrane peptidoglycan carboxypeptidase
LTAGEGTLLAVLPRAPLGYDPYKHKEEALARRTHVLELMEKRGWIDGVGRAVAESERIVLADGAATQWHPLSVREATVLLESVVGGTR